MSLSRSAGGFNLAAFNRIVFAAVLAGLLAGVLLTGLQQLQVSRIILQAEVYEDAAEAASHAPSAASAAPVRIPPAHGQPGHDHAHDHAAPAMAMPQAHDGDAHEHDHHGWQPANGVERTFFTVIANTSVGIAFGLILAAAFCLRGQVSGWREGLLWGVAGYAVFFLAPSLGLPPEVPGTAAAPLASRQFWWLATVLASGSGLALLTFARSWQMKLLGVVLLAAPHLVGAPQPEIPASAAPEALARAFIYATAMANAAFWLALGGLTGHFYKKLA